MYVVIPWGFAGHLYNTFFARICQHNPGKGPLHGKAGVRNHMYQIQSTFCCWEGETCGSGQYLREIHPWYYHGIAWDPAHIGSSFA
jgi:hypothetical protein